MLSLSNSKRRQSQKSLPWPAVYRVSSDDIRPGIQAADVIGGTFMEMLYHKSAFDEWAEQLSIGTKERRNSLEKQLHQNIQELRKHTEIAIDKSSHTLRAHEDFAVEMVALLEYATNNQFGDLRRPESLMVIGKKIADHCDALRLLTLDIQKQLVELLYVVDKIMNKGKARSSLWIAMCNCVAHSLRLLASVLVMETASVPIAVGKEATEPNRFCMPVEPTITAAVIDVCEEVMEHGNDSSYGFETLIHFLRTSWPVEAERARSTNLTEFRACQRLVRIDLAMRKGHNVRLSRYDNNKALDAWHAHRLVLLSANHARTFHTNVIQNYPDGKLSLTTTIQSPAHAVQGQQQQQQQERIVPDEVQIEVMEGVP